MKTLLSRMADKVDCRFWVLTLLGIGSVACGDRSELRTGNAGVVETDRGAIAAEQLASHSAPTSYPAIGKAESSLTPPISVPTGDLNISVASTDAQTHPTEPSPISLDSVEEDIYSELPALNEIDLPYKLLRLGIHHGQEVSATSGEQWWGLFETEDGFELLPTTIEVNTAYDVVIDPEDGPFTGKEVTTNNPNQAILLLQGMEGLEAGDVETERHGLTDLHRTSLSFSGVLQMPGDLSTQAVANENRLIEQRWHNVLTFAAGEIHQAYDAGAIDSPSAGPRLIWAGDLDRDGRLDFLIDNSTYNQSALTLFLSSAAEEGELVRPVARHIATGC